jgi:transposase
MPTVRITRHRARRGVLRSTPSRHRPPQSENTAAKLTRGHRRKLPLLEHALTGLVQDRHSRLLVIQSARIDVLDAQIETLSMEISRCLMEWDADEPPPTAAELPRTVEGEVAPGHPEVPRMCIRAKTLLDTILGVRQRWAEWGVVETGIDMARFGSSAHLTAWVGVAPGNNASAGKPRYGRSRHGDQALRTVLTQLAHTAARTKETYLSALSHPPGDTSRTQGTYCSRGPCAGHQHRSYVDATGTLPGLGRQLF